MATYQAQNIQTWTGSDHPYVYRALPAITSEDNIKLYCSAVRGKLAPIAKTFDDNAHTEWFVRGYLALKYILASTILGSSAQFAEEQNLRVTLPYLHYYTLLNTCRACILTLPGQPWLGERTIASSHSRILSVAIETLARLDKTVAGTVANELWAAKEYRELFSYRFPASGLRILRREAISLDRMIELGRCFTELTQINLACLEGAVKKHKPGQYQLLEREDISRLMDYGIERGTSGLVDEDDWHRIGYFYKKHNAPVALIALATEGLVEDFFGAWSHEAVNGYDPDEHWSLFLNIL
jgi:hypothetical protein